MTKRVKKRYQDLRLGLCHWRRLERERVSRCNGKQAVASEESKGKRSEGDEDG